MRRGHCEGPAVATTCIRRHLKLYAPWLADFLRVTFWENGKKVLVCKMLCLKSNVMLSYNRKEQKQLLPPLFNAKNIAQKSKKNENNIKRPFPLVPVKDCLVWALHYTKKSKKQKKNELNFSISQFARQTEQLFALIIHLLRQWSKDCLKSD